MKLVRKVRAAQLWASQLTLTNVLVVLLLAAAPYLPDSSPAAERTRNLRVLAVVTIAIMSLIVVRTAYDIRRYRQAKELVAEPEFFQRELTTHQFGIMLTVNNAYGNGGYELPYGPHALSRLDEGSQLLLALAFLHKLEWDDRRWWSLFGIRNNVVRYLTGYGSLAACAVWPLKLAHLRQNMRTPRHR